MMDIYNLSALLLCGALILSACSKIQGVYLIHCQKCGSEWRSARDLPIEECPLCSLDICDSTCCLLVDIEYLRVHSENHRNQILLEEAIKRLGFHVEKCERCKQHLNSR